MSLAVTPDFDEIVRAWTFLLLFASGQLRQAVSAVDMDMTCFIALDKKSVHGTSMMMTDNAEPTRDETQQPGVMDITQAAVPRTNSAGGKSRAGRHATRRSIRNTSLNPTGSKNKDMARQENQSATAASVSMG